MQPQGLDRPRLRRAVDVRPEAAETVGTFFLVLAGGAAVLGGLPGLAVALAFGAAVMVLVYALGHVSGAHFNPAVTLGFAATGHFPWRRALPYVAAQVLGALAASLLLRAWAPVGPLVAHGALHGLAAAGVEGLATALLAFVILAVATDPRAAPAAAGLAIGATVFLGALVAGPLSGAAMNPARALAPALVAGDVRDLAATLLGPIVGGVAGMAAYEALRRGSKPTSERVLGALGPIGLEETK